MKIFLTAFPTGGGSGRVHGSTLYGDVLGCALAEDGHVLAQHLSSSVMFAQHDLGLTSDWQHEHYQKHAGVDGFALEWIDAGNLDTHEGWRAAFARNQELKVRSASATPTNAVDPIEGSDHGLTPRDPSASSSTSASRDRGPARTETPPIRAHVEGCPKALRVPVDLCECGGRDFRPEQAR